MIIENSSGSVFRYDSIDEITYIEENKKDIGYGEREYTYKFQVVIKVDGKEKTISFFYKENKEKAESMRNLMIKLMKD